MSDAEGIAAGLAAIEAGRVRPLDEIRAGLGAATEPQQGEGEHCEGCYTVSCPDARRIIEETRKHCCAACGETVRGGEHPPCAGIPAGPVDDPEADGTPFQSDAFTRGENYGIAGAIRRVREAMAGDPGQYADPTLTALCKDVAAMRRPAGPVVGFAVVDADGTARHIWTDRRDAELFLGGETRVHPLTWADGEGE